MEKITCLDGTVQYPFHQLQSDLVIFLKFFISLFICLCLYIFQWSVNSLSYATYFCSNISLIPIQDENKII